MRSATAIRCDEIDDVDKLDVTTVDCYRCDPDNPLAVPRETCPTCRGTGRAAVELVPIMREILESKSHPRKPSARREEEDDLFLEY